eukprot:752110-Hanusia_phi.AAC.9
MSGSIPEGSIGVQVRECPGLIRAGLLKEYVAGLAAEHQRQHRVSDIHSPTTSHRGEKHDLQL